jgi:DNA-binding transcriptional LysR family regulator
MSAKTRSLTLRQLEIFATAAREGSFTRAAHTLLLSEPAVSQQVKLLENVVGARLFTRSPRRPISLTDAGGLLLQTCESVFQQFDATLEQLEALRGAEAARVSLGVGTSFGSYLLPPVVASFGQKYPGITVTVGIEMSGHWDEKVRRREIDLAVVTDHVDDHELTGVPFAEKSLVWIGLSGHPLAGSEPAPVEALRDERLILGPPLSSSRRALDRLAEAHGMALRPAFELAGTQAFITAVTSGMGIALVPYHAMLSREMPRGLAVLNVTGFPLPLEWSLIWRGQDLSPAASIFKDYLLQYRHKNAARLPSPQKSPPTTGEAELATPGLK